MLALCRKKAASQGIDVGGRLFAQEMDALALARRYATILVASSTFQLITDPARAARAMACFHDRLVPGGVLAMSIMSKLWRGKRTPAQMEWSDWLKLAEAPRAEEGDAIRRWIRTRYDHDNQLEHEENRYEVLRNGAVVHTETHARAPAVRWYSQSQAAACCEAAGFAKVVVTSGFTFEPAQPSDTTFCLLATRA